MPASGGGALAPLKVAPFRRIWTSSVVSNFGHLILGVGAAWEMTRLTDNATMIAAVQTALMLPLMLVALPAGALADMFDRRKVAMTGLSFACVGGITLAVIALLGLVTPWLLLVLVFCIGAGVALYGPAWQASVSELVSNAQLPAAVALGSVSYNLARSIGPAIGGAIILAAGAQAAFSVNAVGYIPLIIAFLVWRREPAASRLPPESLGRALVSGMRYAAHASGVRNAIVRSFMFGFASGSATALAPLVAKDQLGGDAGVYGILLGASGIGAIFGSLSTTWVRERLGPEIAVRVGTGITAISLIGIALSPSVWLSAGMFAVQGLGTMLVLAMLNVGVQLSVPRWVTARALSLFSSSITGGIAIGAMVWGAVVQRMDIQAAMLASGIMLGLTILLGFVLPLIREEGDSREPFELTTEPQVALQLTSRSGPVVIEIDYRVDPADAREFYQAMEEVGKTRRRNGGFDWSLARDIGDPWLWVERYECPTWGDYLHMRNRFTEADRQAQEKVETFNHLNEVNRARRRLMRPSGSVRWRAETPDTGSADPGPFAL